MLSGSHDAAGIFFPFPGLLKGDIGSMANVFDYLAWRGDIPLTAAPFNEVDSLILSELAYTDFGDIVPQNGTGVRLKDAAEAFFAVHDRESVKVSRSYTAKAALLMDGMLSGDRFRNTVLSHYMNDVDEEKGMQLAAVTFHLDDGTAYVAFRGTDGSLVGWKENFNLSVTSLTEGRLRAVEYLAWAARSVPGPLIVGGHSKGGNLAVFASAFCREDVRDRIVKIYTHDGPGFREEITGTKEYREAARKVISIVPETSVIGQLMEDGYDHRVVRSSAAGLTQHDGLTWQVMRDRFEEAEKSPASDLVDRTMDDFLGRMDDKERADLTETLFDVLGSTGSRTLSGIGTQGLRSVERIANAVRSLPKERQQETLETLKKLGISGGQALVGYLSDLIGKKNGPSK